VGPGRGVHEVLFKELQSAAAADGIFVFRRIRDLYPRFEYADIVKHKAIVLIPYQVRETKIMWSWNCLFEFFVQVSIISIIEYYRMAIPLFAPSPSLLTKWQLEHRVMFERTWLGVRNCFRRKSSITQHPESRVPFDPNDEFDEVDYVLKLCIG
jgi:hypothetical protein